MKLRPLTGTITALATPFRDGRISYIDLKNLIAYQIKGGINGLVPVGTTGESPTLSYEEHMDVIRHVIAEARGRVPVIAGTGSNSTHEAIELTKLSHDAGADAMLVVAPYYNKPSQEGLFRHFCEIAEVTDKPIILYSIPSRCGVEIGVGVVERLRAKYKHVAWIKEAGGSVDRVDQLKQALGSDITVLSGDDALTLPFMSVGAEGVISVASNLYVREIGRMVRHALANDFTKAARIHRQLYPAFKTLFIEPNPVPIKAALVRAGVISSGEVRSPLCAMEPANDTVAESVQRTHRVLVLHEDTLTGGIGGDIAAYIAEHLFDYLDAPVMRVGSLDSPVPFSEILEKQFLPVTRLYEQMQKLISY